MVASLFATSMLAAAIRTSELKYRTLYLKRCLTFRVLTIGLVTLTSLFLINNKPEKIGNKNIAFSYYSGFNQKEILPPMLYL
jgi:hypothetical protein